MTDLCMMIHNVLNFQLIRNWCKSILLYNGDRICTTALRHINGLNVTGNIMEDYIMVSAIGSFSYKELVVLLVENCCIYNENLLTSSDEVVSKIATFMKYCFNFELYTSSTRKGDAIAIELIMADLLPLWKDAKNHKLVDLTATNAETLCRMMDSYMLEMMHVNRCTKLLIEKRMVGMSDVFEQLNDHTR